MSNNNNVQEADPWLSYFPPTFFVVVMGISGLGLAWRYAEKLLFWPSFPGTIILIMGSLILLVSILLYTSKLIYYPKTVKSDFTHPIKIAFLGALPVAIILQVSAIAPLHQKTAEILWLIGAPSSLILNFNIFSRWYLLNHWKNKINSLWLIPAAGSFLVAIAGIQVGYNETAWFFFAIGMMFGCGILIIIIYKYISDDKLLDHLIPSYFVPIVPPALVSISYPMLTNWQAGDEISSLVRIMFYFSLFLLLFNLSMIKIFLRLDFSMGWWAYTFPLDTITIAVIVYAHSTENIHLQNIGIILLIASTVFIIYILGCTLIEIKRGNVFRSEISSK
jgi:tellurite resistance protein